MEIAKIKYEDLNSRQKEVFNFHKVASALADYGFNCLKLTDDWEGADFLAYRMVDSGRMNTLKVQLKGRLTIDRKYTGKDIWITFPLKGSWYLIEHDVLVEKVRQTTNWLNTEAWATGGQYHSDSPNAALTDNLAESRL
jgi:hypothetical protein